MKADQLCRALWLAPWQAPEVIAESMVSSKSEVYALAAIIWEIWAGNNRRIYKLSLLNKI